MRSSFGRNSDEVRIALDCFSDVNYQYRYYAIFQQFQYEFSLEDFLSYNTEIFHSYIRKKKGDLPSIGPLNNIVGEVTYDAKNMADLFASSFSSAFTTSLFDNPEPRQECDGCISEMDISINDVIAAPSARNPSPPPLIHLPLWDPVN